MIRDLVAGVRGTNRDFAVIEVKRAADGAPTFGETVRAFGNMPTDDTIVLGVDCPTSSTTRSIGFAETAPRGSDTTNAGTREMPRSSPHAPSAN